MAWHLVYLYELRSECAGCESTDLTVGLGQHLPTPIKWSWAPSRGEEVGPIWSEAPSTQGPAPVWTLRLEQDKGGTEPSAGLTWLIRHHQQALPPCLGAGTGSVVHKPLPVQSPINRWI